MSIQPVFLKNAISFLQGRFPTALVVHGENRFANQIGEHAFTVWPMITQDPSAGIMQRGLAIHDITRSDELAALASNLFGLCDQLATGTLVTFSNADPKGHSISTTQMAFAPRLLLYTNKVHLPYKTVIDAFSSAGILIDIIEEAKMFFSVFISYGGPDNDEATTINEYLTGKGIKTWFFPQDSLPGEKLHRMMHEGVNGHDRFLLICSKASLTRPGMLNEIERVLEREAKEGGTAILIPVTLDDYVYGDWAPARPDLAEQIRSRVITKIDLNAGLNDTATAQLEKVVKALAK